MVTGPLTGTMASTGGRYSVVTKSPLTGAIACSNSGGFIGNGDEERRLGHDHLRGQGGVPGLPLRRERAMPSCCSPTSLWGTSVWDTDELLHAKHQDPRLRIACDRPRGESGCLYSAVVNDLHRAAGRSGVGTVMASKNLKAVAVRGTKGSPASRTRCASCRPPRSRQGGARGERGHRPGPAGLRHAGADERHQRDRGDADPQHAR